MMFSFWDFFSHPLLRGPMWGTLFLSMTSSLLGVILFFQRKPLLGETLSHAAYPGLLVGCILASSICPENIASHFWVMVAGGFFFSFLGLKALNFLQRRKGVYSDTALCFVLASFFGVGTLLASILQFQLPHFYKNIQMLLFGQAATMSDSDIFIYAAIFATCALFFIFSFHPIKAYLFDPSFAKSACLPVSRLEKILVLSFLISLILGIRSVGVLLISGMSIAPVIGARCFTDRLNIVCILSICFGMVSAIGGNMLSIWGSTLFQVTMPTGPMIILLGAIITLLSLLFAPKKGWLFRMIRIGSYRLRRLEENVLKGMWKKGKVTWSELKRFHHASFWLLALVLFRLKREGWVEDNYSLSIDGKKKAASIVRLHRLWELYLAHALGEKSEKVHMNAEEMEHIITPDLEKRLTQLLSNPQKDPHNQEIPERQTL